MVGWLGGHGLLADKNGWLIGGHGLLADEKWLAGWGSWFVG
jgi:hypothetical protein